MHGQHEEHASDAADRMQVDAELERDLVEVERSVLQYLQDPTGASRDSLRASLNALDDRAAQSDAYESSVIGSGAVGFAARGEVLGETSIDPVVAEVPGAELQAQVSLVTAAKDEVRAPTPDTLAALRSASGALTAVRDGGAAGH